MPSFKFWTVVNRNWSAREAIQFSKRTFHGDIKTADTMPIVSGIGLVEVKFMFFKPSYVITDLEEVERERRKRGLWQDTIAQIRVNAIHPDFSRNQPNGDCWQDENGKWHTIYFHKHEADKEDCLNIYDEPVWNSQTWFGGAMDKVS